MPRNPRPNQRLRLRQVSKETVNRSRGIARASIVLAICALQGCVADGPQPRTKPSIGPQPRNSQADVLLLNLGPPTDSDGDTTPDTFIASVHIFDERYQLPVEIAGKMTIMMYAESDETPLHTWSFEGSKLQQQMMRAQVGPVYRFRLRVPIDAEPVRKKYVTVQCIFEEPTGERTQAWHRDLPWMSVLR